MKTCPQCKQTKPFSDYGKDKKNKDGLCTYCKFCINARKRKWKSKNKNKVKKINTEYRKRPEIKEQKIEGDHQINQK